MTKIDQPIVSYAVVSDVAVQSEPMPKILERPDVLLGTTYKVKTPLSEHALYITINDIEVQGIRRPFEVFINSKAMENFQWVTALTRVMSAVFRHGGEVNFLIEELRSVCDPKGGFFDKSKYVPSLVAKIGDILEQHLVTIGLYVRDTSLQQAAVAMIQEKQKPSSLSNSTLCSYCNEVAVVIMDGCATCTSCGQSKCG